MAGSPGCPAGVTGRALAPQRWDASLSKREGALFLCADGGRTRAAGGVRHAVRARGIVRRAGRRGPEPARMVKACGLAYAGAVRFQSMERDGAMPWPPGRGGTLVASWRKAGMRACPAQVRRRPGQYPCPVFFGACPRRRALRQISRTAGRGRVEAAGRRWLRSGPFPAVRARLRNQAAPDAGSVRPPPGRHLPPQRPAAGWPGPDRHRRCVPDGWSGCRRGPSRRRPAPSGRERSA